MEKVLFICVHNSARSQMAEAFLSRLGADDVVVESAGLEPTEINPLVVEVMEEEGIDLRGKSTQSVFELFKKGNTYTYVITVCDEAADDKCPVFPGMTHRVHMPFLDPAEVQGTAEEKLVQVREIRDQIKSMVLEFIDFLRSGDRRQLGDLWNMNDA